MATSESKWQKVWEALVRVNDDLGQSLTNLQNLIGGAKAGDPPAQNLIHNLLIAIAKHLPEWLKEIEPYIKPGVDDAAVIVRGLFGPLAGALEAPLRQWAHQSFLDKAGELTTRNGSTPENAEAVAADAMASAFGFGMASKLAASAFEFFLPKDANVLNGVAPMLSTLAGFDEVSGAVIDALYENAFGKSLEYHYRSHFKPELPAEPNAVRWHSQRLLTDAQLKRLFHYSGMKEEYEPAFIASAYRAIQPRALTTLFEDQEFPRDDVQHMLDFAGVRDIDQHVLLQAYEWNSTKNVRSQYLSALLASGEAGLMDDSTIDGHLDTLRFSRQAKNYVHSTIAIKRLEKQAALYLRSVSTLYETGQLDDAQYVPALEAIGLARAEAEAHYGVDSARLKGKVMAQQEREAARLATQTQREGIQAIRAAYLALP